MNLLRVGFSRLGVSSDIGEGSSPATKPAEVGSMGLGESCFPPAQAGGKWGVG